MTTILLAGVGALATGGGLVMAFAPEWANLTEIGAVGAFSAHLTQSRGSALLGLGLLALASASRPSAWRVVLPPLALVSALFAAVLLLVQMSGLTSSIRLVLSIMLVVSAAVFAGQPSRSDTPVPDLVSPWRDPAWLLAVTFAAWTGLTGLMWLVAPGAMGAFLTDRAGAGSGYVAVTRGAIDLSLAWAVWRSRTGLTTPGGVPVLAAILAANIALSAVGLMAQLHAIATPSRWLIEGLHVVWTLAAAVLLWRALARSKSKPSA